MQAATSRPLAAVMPTSMRMANSTWTTPARTPATPAPTRTLTRTRSRTATSPGTTRHWPSHHRLSRCSHGVDWSLGSTRLVSTEVADDFDDTPPWLADAIEGRG